MALVNITFMCRSIHMSTELEVSDCFVICLFNYECILVDVQPKDLLTSLSNCY